MVRPRGSRPVRPAPVASGWSGDDAFGSGLMRGAVCGATVGAAACAILGILSSVEREIIFMLVALGSFVGSLIGVGSALGALLVLGLGGRRRSDRSWGLSVAAAAVAAVISVLGTELVIFLDARSGLDTVGVAVIGVVTGALALWQVRRMAQS